MRIPPFSSLTGSLAVDPAWISISYLIMVVTNYLSGEVERGGGMMTSVLGAPHHIPTSL